MMKIDRLTKISKLIQFNPDVIDVIASINLNFNKLKNPFLRKILAPRVSIENAAKIGGVSIEEFVKKIETLGFIYEKTTNEDKTDISENMNNSFEIENQHIIELDVRPDLAKGKDPFSIILNAIDNLKENEILKLINTFKPVPIINVLKQKGFNAKIENPSTGLYYVYFKRTLLDKSTENEVVESEMGARGNFEEVFAFFGENYHEIDVRDLEMPQPMVQILENLHDLPANYCLYVHHKKIPQFLLPQLKERNFVFQSKEIDEDNIKMLIYKNK